MVRFTTFLLLALSALLLCAPSIVTPADAITYAEAADTDGEGINAGTINGDDDDADGIPDIDGDDEEDYDGDSEDDDDDDGGLDDEGEDPVDDGANDPSEPEKSCVIDPPGDEKATYKAPEADGAVFFDSFQSGFAQWTHSEVPDYSGKFVIGQGAKPTFRGDRALIIPEKARKYGLSTKIPGLDNLSAKDFVVQYELKLEEGVSCGGAYLKLLLPGFEPKVLNGDTPYSVMFGPDKCGGTDKVHFIFQSENPKTGEHVEHHLTSSPAIANSYDKKTHLYTLIVRNDATFELLVDMEKKSYGSLTDKFAPPVQPDEKIDDPEDKKPENWVDDKTIPNPDAKKPDSWDEDAPKQIPDMEAVKPEGWLDDEPEQIKDPETKKPDEWDEEEDGEWEAPMVPNPECEAVGCGEWVTPMKANPDYKGKWSPGMIDNPRYIGEWSAKKIDNPKYYKVEESHLLGIGGVAFEIWTMDQGVLFDNLYIGNDVEAAERYANSTFRVKQKTEMDRDEAERKKEEEESTKNDKSSGKKANTSKMGKTLGPVMDKIEDYVEKLETLLQPLEAWLNKQGMEPYLDSLIDKGIKKPMLVVVAVPLLLTLLILIVVGGGKKDEDEEESSMVTGATEVTEVEKKKGREAMDKEAEDEVEAEDIDGKEGENGIESTGLRQRAVATEE